MAEPHRDEISKLEALYSDNPEGRVFTLLAEAYRKGGELDRAREVLEHGLKRHSEYASAYVVLGRVLLDLQQGEDAVDAFTRVLQLDPENLVALRALGDRARTMGHTADALRYYRELLNLDPSDEELQETVASLEKDLVDKPATASTAAVQEPAWGTMSVLDEVSPPLPGFGNVSLDSSGFGSSAGQPASSGEFGNISFSSEPGLDDVAFSGDSLSLGGDVGSTEGGASFGGGGGFAGLSLTPDAGGSLDSSTSADRPLNLGADTAWGSESASDFGLPGFDEPAVDRPSPSSFEQPAAEFTGLPAFDEPETGPTPFGGFEPVTDAAAFPMELPLIEEPVAPSEPDIEPETVGSGSPYEISALAPDADDPYDAFPFTTDGESTPAVPALDGWSADPEDPVAREAAAAGAEPWVLEDEASVGGEVVTETMAELYRSQGLNDRAAEVYRTLLAERPGDAALTAKLHEVELAAAEADHAPSAWTEANTAQAAPESLYAWTGDGATDEPDGSPPVGEYFGSLLAWRPARPVKRPAGSVGQPAPAPPVGKPAPAPPSPPVQTPAAREPVPTPVADVAPTPAPSGAKEDDLAWLFDDEPVEEAPKAALPPKGAPAPRGQESAAPAAGAAEGEDDDDLDMFRSWLQSLKR
jgi:hypothetical protein